IMAIVMVAMLAFGGTYAYFTANADSFGTSEVTMATVQISTNSSSTFATNKKVLPGAFVVGTDSTDATITVENKSDVKTYIFATLTATVGGQNTLYVMSGENGETKESLLKVTTDYEENTLGDGWTRLSAGSNIFYLVVEDKDAAAGAGVADDFIVSAQISNNLSSNRTEATNTDGFTETHNVYTDANCTQAYSGKIMGAAIEVSIDFEAIQFDGSWSDASGAYDVLHPSQD
ncbi:MAG: hypothetical protein IJD48_00105, partial [Clostridia bacterium]|nr:hypothetical protein [Clostridia bacterium]